MLVIPATQQNKEGRSQAGGQLGNLARLCLSILKKKTRRRLRMRFSGGVLAQHAQGWILSPKKGENNSANMFIISSPTRQKCSTTEVHSLALF